MQPAHWHRFNEILTQAIGRGGQQIDIYPHKKFTADGQTQLEPSRTFPGKIDKMSHRSHS